MDTRRYVNESRSRTLAQFRWLGWVMIMMFVLVQVAMGASPIGGRSDTMSPEGGTFDQASASFNPETHQVVVTANVPPADWASTVDIGRHSFVVYEDNVRQPVDDVEVTHAPLSIGLLLENAGRYHALNEVIQACKVLELGEFEIAANKCRGRSFAAKVHVQPRRS